MEEKQMKKNTTLNKNRETDKEITTNRLADRYLSIKCQDVKCLAMILEDQQPEHWVYQFVISM